MGFSHEAPTGTPLWLGPTAFHHLQLLPPQALIRDGKSAEPLSLDFGRGAGALRFRVAGIRGDARAHSFADQRAEGGEPGHGDAGAEAARLASDARASKEAPSSAWTTADVGGGARAETASFLAATVL